MRGNPDRFTKCYLREMYTDQDDDGLDYIAYGKPKPIDLILRVADNSSGEIMTNEPKLIFEAVYYGDLLDFRNNVNDGVCLFVDSNTEPDFEITFISPFTRHMTVRLESRVG